VAPPLWDVFAVEERDMGGGEGGREWEEDEWCEWAGWAAEAEDAEVEGPLEWWGWNWLWSS